MSHIYYELYYHLIWATKNREPVIDDILHDILEKNLKTKIIKLGSQLLEFNSISDHCHLLIKTVPQISISDLVGKLKGYSSYEINKLKGPKFLEWQQGFGVLSLNRKGIPFVKKYILNQKEHHRNRTTINILEQMNV